MSEETFLCVGGPFDGKRYARNGDDQDLILTEKSPAKALNQIRRIPPGDEYKIKRHKYGLVGDGYRKLFWKYLGRV